jgi:hypothetical protein
MITATRTHGGASTATRVVLTLVGAGLTIVGAFMAWLERTAGTDLSWKAFTDTSTATSKSFVTTVGAVFILLGLLGVLGLAERSGWLTRVAGAVGLVGWILVAIQVYRGHTQDVGAVTERLGAGAWLALAGVLVMLVAGFLGTTADTVDD